MTHVLQLGRRKLFGLLAIVAARPAIALAQSGKPLVGFVNNGAASSFRPLYEAFQRGLAEAGFVDGQVAIEARWADGDNSRLPALMHDLIGRRVDVVAATGGTPTALAAKSASATTPVVFAIGADPVKFGLVASLNRPGGNVTGVSFLANTLLAKQVEVLHEAVAKDAVIGFLVNPEIRTRTPTPPMSYRPQPSWAASLWWRKREREARLTAHSRPWCIRRPARWSFFRMLYLPSRVRN
jgi:putative ABC transport system substrate-binding protein